LCARRGLVRSPRYLGEVCGSGKIDEDAVAICYRKSGDGSIVEAGWII